jgi:hypothetical protein
MSVGAPLDLPAVFRWCREKFAADPGAVLFQTGHLSQVLGLRLTDGRALVVKVRPWQQRLIACGQVQEHLHSKGFPAPQVLVSPTQQGDFAISAETLVNGGELLETDSGSAAQFAEALHLLVQEAPRVESVSSLDPSPAWVGWDHKATRLWPDPDDRPGDLNTHDRRRWLDDVGAAAREQLLALDQPLVIGHGDWSSANLRWTHRRLRVVHDWDSVIAQPEAAIAGHAAAIWPGTGEPGEVANLTQSEDFLNAYMDASGRSWTAHEVRAAWAAGLWTRAFDAKKASLTGDDPYLALTRSEADERGRLAGF